MTCWQIIRAYLDRKKPKLLALKELPEDKVVMKRWKQINTDDDRYSPE